MLNKLFVAALGACVMVGANNANALHVSTPDHVVSSANNAPVEFHVKNTDASKKQIKVTVRNEAGHDVSNAFTVIGGDIMIRPNATENITITPHLVDQSEYGQNYSCEFYDVSKGARITVNLYIAAQQKNDTTYKVTKNKHGILSVVAR